MSMIESQGEVYPLALNFEDRLVIRTDDVLGDVRTLLDSAGDETDDEDEAVFLIVEWRDGGWSHMRRDEFVSAAGSH